MTLPIDRVDLESLDIADLQQQKLKALFPEVFTEGGKIDFDKLKLTLGQAIDAGKERFGMNWAGKADCYKTIQQPSVATLAPARDESIDFDTTENLFIEGDNLEVLKLLQKSYLGKVKMIYIDPPYNTGNDFIYPDNYSENLDTYLEYTGQIDGEGRKFSTNPDTDGRFHSKWMNMMYPRLFLAKNLLREDGVIFISIDDKEARNLRSLCDEVFGEFNFVSQMIIETATDNNPTLVATEHEYMMIYCKNKSEHEEWLKPSSKGLLIQEKYESIKKEAVDLEDIQKKLRAWIRENKQKLSGVTHYDNVDEKGVYHDADVANPKFGGYFYDVIHPITKKPCKVPDKGYRYPKSTMDALILENNIVFGRDENTIIKPKKRITDAKSVLRSVIYNDGRAASKRLSDLVGRDVFKFPKDELLLSEIFGFVTEKDKNDVILDFFAGSATTAHAVMNLNREDGGNRSFVLVQLPEKTYDATLGEKTPKKESKSAFEAGYQTIAEISKERIRRASAKIQAEQNEAKGKADLFDEGKANNLLDLGFRVFKLQKSNFKVWDASTPKDAEAIQQALELHVDHIDPRAEQEAILFELLLKSGFELTTPIENLTLAGKTVFSIAEGALLICLDKALTSEVIKAMAEINPSRVICLDEGFQDNDQLKTNAVLIMKSQSVNDFRTV